jgi:carbon storage regulator
MLVLSRRPGEEIVLGDNIRVTVVAIQGNKVRLGVSAPADVRILRTELSEAPPEASRSGPQPAGPSGSQTSAELSG